MKAGLGASKALALFQGAGIPLPKEAEKVTPAGHTHDFETVIVWLDTCNEYTAKVVAVSYSGHGDYSTAKRNAAFEPYLLNGTHPSITYAYHNTPDWGTTHRVYPGLQATDAAQRSNATLISYDRLTPQAKASLNQHWGSAVCSVCGEGFDTQLAEAVLQVA